MSTAQLAPCVTRRQLTFVGSFFQILLAFPCHFRSRRDLEFKPFVWFRAKTEKGIVCLADHLHNVTDACRNIFNRIKTSGHSSLEKFTSHFIERVVCERELETEQNCNILSPQLFWLSQPFFSRFHGLLNRGAGCPASAGTWFSFQHLLSNSLELWTPTDLKFLSPGLFNNLTSTYSLRASQFVPWYLRPDAPVIYKLNCLK